jgi:2,5-dichlorohydroquinone reductive dechlorinase
MPYVSHPVNLFHGESYLPGYVRLRMTGCDSLGGRMASQHSGSTSTEAGGCDGAVVPTLIDWKQDRVIVDSKRICLHLDDQIPEASKLCPIPLAEQVNASLAVVDNIPNYQMLMGRTARASEASNTKSSTGSEFSKRKVAWCDSFLQDFSGDDVLVRAYTAKRAKELSAATDLFSPDAMDAAYAKADTALQGLEQLLRASRGAWIFGDTVTMADLFWGIELLRMDNIGSSHLWDGRLPEVTRFLASTADLQCIRTAILEWPGSIF